MAKHLIILTIIVLNISNCSSEHSNGTIKDKNIAGQLNANGSNKDCIQTANWYGQHPAQGKWELHRLYTHWPSKDSVIEANEIWDFSADPFINIYENDSLQYKYVAEWNMEVDSTTSDTAWKLTIVDQYTASMALMTVTKSHDTLRLEESCENCSLYEFVK